MKPNNPVLPLLFAVLLMSCTKVINVDLKNATPEIVIEGIVDNSGLPAKVTISKSVSFSTGNIYPAVTGAIVQITDNTGGNYRLVENPAGIYTNPTLTGVPGRTYSLSVIAGGKSYTAVSTMPSVVVLDSLIQDKLSLTKPTIFVSAVFSDPPGFGNNYQFIETVNGKRNKTIFILPDIYQDGGIIENQLLDEELKLKAGDRVSVEMQCLDKNVYRYLKGLEDLQTGGTVPANPETNISNNPLGYFSAHTSQKKSIIIR
jgi:Domain of unknown function (DUF4249)